MTIRLWLQRLGVLSTIILSSLPVVPANAQTSAVTHLIVLAGNGQVACQCSSSTLQSFLPISVKATDQNGNPVAGATVGWVVTGGQATVGSLTTVTGSDGTASNTVNLIVFDNQATVAAPFLVSTRSEEHT